MKRTTLLAAGLMLALTACGEQQAPSSPGDGGATDAAATTMATEAAADPLEGTWATEEMTRDELKQAALEAGFSDADIEQLITDGLADVSAAAFQIRFLDGHASQFMTPPGEGAIPQHDGPYRLADDQTLVWTDEDCDTTVAFELDGDALAFTEIVEDQCPAADSQIAHLTFLLSGPYTRAD